MKWYIPAWNGDLRLLPHEKEPETKTTLLIEKPTADEVRALTEMGEHFQKEGWVEGWDPLAKSSVGFRAWLFGDSTVRLTINAPLSKVGPVAASVMKTGPAVLTALKFANGRIETSSEGLAGMQAIAESAEAAPAENPAEAVVTVSRPTPCCPQCIPGSVEMASEVLLSFLNEEEHRMWADKRQIVITGGLSGHRYLLAHRHSPDAQKIGRVCYDLDAEAVVHFHQWTVPPEEEILAAKLILEHREPWLRNEATLFGASSNVLKFKNPFGDILDGTKDATLTYDIGAEVSRLLQS